MNFMDVKPPKIEKALVCICIPTFNAENTIVETLNSLLSQTYQKINFIVVDNCSTDDTLNLVNAFDDKRLTIVKNSHNLGSEGNFTKCIELSQGAYTGIYHADDIYEPTMVEEQVKFLESHPAANAVLTEALTIDELGHITGSLSLPAQIRKNAPIFTFDEIFKAVLKHSNFLICPSAMVKTEIYKKEIQSWRGSLFNTSADLDVWFRILLLGPIGILPKKLMRYRISGQQGSASVRLNFERADFFKVIDFYLTQNRIKEALTSQDQRNYLSLERRDLAMRSVNLFILGNKEAVIKLCPPLLNGDIWLDAFRGKRGLGVLIAVLGLRMMPMMGLGGVASSFFKKAKSIFKK